MVVARNDAYWGEKALLESITFRFFPDATTRVLALLAGEVDLIVDLPRQQIASVAARPDLAVSRAPVGQVMSLQLNAHGREPHTLLGDRALRRAIGHSIDRNQLVKQVWRGEAEVLQTMTVPAILGKHAALVKGLAFDRAKAARMLDEAGWLVQGGGIRSKAGRPLRLTLIANPEIDAAAVQFIQAQLRAVGIDVRWDRLPDIATFAARGNAGACDLNLASANQNDANPVFLPALIYYSKSLRPFVRWYAVGPEFDRIVEEGLRAEDTGEGRRLAAEAMHLAIDVEAINLPLAGLFRIYGLKTSVQGFVPHPAQTHQDWTPVHRK
jgi:peptide/nickel transport system substrate-binding protein